MRIVNWNCSKKFHEGKFLQLQSLNADIYIIQEYTTPTGKYHGFSSKTFAKLYSDSWNFFSSNMIIDTETNSKNKRNYNIAIFAKPEVHITPIMQKDDGLQLFLPVKINNAFTLIAYHANPHVGALDMYCYTKIYVNELKQQKHLLICGDFNDHPRWDDKNPSQNFTGIVENMSIIGLKSFYHLKNNINHGQETEYTFYLHRNKLLPYHIDYCFGSPSDLIDFQLGKYDDWCKPVPSGCSDHVPLIIDIKD